MLFSPARIANLQLPNRLIRSATAECMAEPDGRPQPRLHALYQELARGGVGLIISGNISVHPSGKSDLVMVGLDSDALIPPLKGLTDAVHRAGGLIVAQLTHGGMKCVPEAVPRLLAPSAAGAAFLKRDAREMTREDIEVVIDAFGQAARRARQAGFDGVQIHGAHGYLLSQFMSPLTNRRTDEWGGDLEGRMRFLCAVCCVVREQVGPGYPAFIKLGVQDALPGGLSAAEGVRAVAALQGMGMDAVEISGGVEGEEADHIRPAIRSPADEAYYRPLARLARPATGLPLLLVGGLRSLAVMEDVLASGEADFISLCRPLICEPDLPNRLRRGLQDRSRCISGNRCWPQDLEEGIACRCLTEK